MAYSATFFKNYKLLSEYKYKLGDLEKGYNNRTLYINITNNEIYSKSVSEEMKQLFTGGKGFDLWLLWNAVTSQTKWDSPENEICISSGPLGGTTNFPGSGKSIFVTISPTTESVVDSNVGGHFGPFLKFSGWDCLEIQGKAQEDIIIFINGDEGLITIHEIHGIPVNTYDILELLPEQICKKEKDLRNISIVSAGSGSENTYIGCLNVSWYDPKRKTTRIKQAGRGGIGSVFRNKKIKAIVVKYSGSRGNMNHPADRDRVSKWGTKVSREIKNYDDEQYRMRRSGTSYLVELVNGLDVLPVHNYKFGSHPEAEKIFASVFEKKFTQGVFDGCWLGCTMSCCKAVDNFVIKTGPYQGKVFTVDGPEYETIAAIGSNCGIFDPDYIIEANFYCDNYAIDTISFGTVTSFLMECYEIGLINRETTGGLELKFGNKNAAMDLLHQMASGEGFGIIAGMGIRRLKKYFVDNYGVDRQVLQDIGMESKGMEFSLYVTKECLAQQAGYGLALKGAHHDETCFVSNPYDTMKELVDALFWFPIFRTWLSLSGLCKIVYNDIVPIDNRQTDDPRKILDHVKGYANFFSGVTGIETTEDDLITMSERVYNFQRVFNLKMGFGTREHDIIPYRAMGPVTEEEYESRKDRYDSQLEKNMNFHSDGAETIEKVKVLRKYRERQYELFRQAIYAKRGWNPKGVPTIETLKRLQIDIPEAVKLVERYS